MEQQQWTNQYQHLRVDFDIDLLTLINSGQSRDQSDV
jgi:hypothetical protein